MIGRRTRQDIIAAFRPELASVIHATGRGAIAAALYVSGDRTFWPTVAVLAAAVLIVGVESRISIALADGLNRLRAAP